MKDVPVYLIQLQKLASNTFPALELSDASNTLKPVASNTHKVSYIAEI